MNNKIRGRWGRWVILASLLIGFSLTARVHAATAVEVGPITKWAGKTIAGFLAGQVLNAVADHVKNLPPVEQSKISIEPVKHRAWLATVYKGQRNLYWKEYFRESNGTKKYAIWSETNNKLNGEVKRDVFEIDPGRMQTRCQIYEDPKQPPIWSATGSVETDLVISHKVVAPGRNRGPDNPKCVVHLKGDRYNYCETKQGSYDQFDLREIRRNAEVPYWIPENQVEVTFYEAKPSS